MKTNNHARNVHTPLGEQTSSERLSTVLAVYYMGTSANIYQRFVGCKVFHGDQDGLPRAQRASSAILWGKDPERFPCKLLLLKLGY